MVNPLHDIIGSEGDRLAGRKIVLGVTGSISAYRAPDVARTLMRQGAEVVAVMSDMAEQIIHPNLMEWATGNPVITKLTGRIEHVTFTTGPARADAIVIAPCTANTIGKIANGIDDTPVTSFVSSALGEQLPIIIAPAMHETMYEQPILKANVWKLSELGIVFVPPTQEEGKAKLAPPESILENLIAAVGPRNYVGKKIVITAGPTVEPIDAVRIITNPSSGKMGSAIAFEAVKRGADVTVIHGPINVPLPRNASRLPVRTTREMYEATMRTLRSTKPDVVIATAAAADYAPVQFSGKVETLNTPRLALQLTATPKIIDDVKKISPRTLLVAFRAQAGLPKDEAVADGFERLTRAGADIIAVNDVSRTDIGFGSDFNEITLIDAQRRTIVIGKASKRVVAGKLLDEIIKRLPKQ